MREGIIYKLVSGKKVYIGSTIQPFPKRLSEHRSEYRRYVDGKRPYCSSFDVIKDKDCKVHILQKVEVKSERELTNLEQCWITKLGKQNRIKSNADETHSC